MAPFGSLLAPFGRILVTFVEGLGDFLEAFPRQMEICTYVLEFFLSFFFSALPVPLLRQVYVPLLFFLLYLSCFLLFIFIFLTTKTEETKTGSLRD